ncbi:MAG TPA: TonB-dependent receptor [Acidocella sp.]|nr:TonB-dependent receptor [Acidocella sp.]
MRNTLTLRYALSRTCSRHALGLAVASFAFINAVPAMAQTAANAPVNLDLGSVLAASSSGASTDYQDTPGTAPYEAPSVTPLNSTQPTSLVTQHTIENNFSSTQSYADFARLTPSVNSINPNGPGLAEAIGPTIRGLQDGQYNVTFDGIPLGDSNDFTHHTTSFFADHDIGQTIVDRGPGTAETVGDATFGGTISIRSKDPQPDMTLTPYGSYGSYNTIQEGLQFDTGSIAKLNGASAFFDAGHIKSDGALSYAGQERSNFLGKVVIPLGSNTTLTLFSSYQKLYQNPPNYGTSVAQMQAFGNSNYAYNNNPNSQEYYKYNADYITTDMEYADLTSNLGNGWLYDGKAYTYGYYHHDLNTIDPFDTLPGGQSSNGTANQVQLTVNGAPVSGIPGETFGMTYRSFGTIQRFQKDFSFGDVKFGAWFDRQSDNRYVYEVSLTNGNVPNYDTNTGGVGNVTAANNNGTIARLQHNQLYTFQPYAQFDWKPTDNLTLTAGVKYAFFRRQLFAPVNQVTGISQGYEHNYGKILPSFEAKYKFNPNLSAYAQAAEGFLAPNLNAFYTNNLTNHSIAPESTLNFQVGTAYQDQHLALGADVYDIHFQNFLQPTPATAGGKKAFYQYENIGGAFYRGIEGEATYTFDSGISLFGNGGYNEAYSTIGHVAVNMAPQFTTNAGISYDHNGIYASLIDQWTGGEYSGNSTVSPAGGKSPGGWYDPYNVVNLSLGYTFDSVMQHVKHLSVKLNVDNLTDQNQFITDLGNDASGNPLYLKLTGISAFFSVSVPLTF